MRLPVPIVVVILALAWPTLVQAQAAAGDAPAGTDAIDPSEGLRVSEPLRELGAAWKRIEAGRSAAVNKAIAGMRDLNNEDYGYSGGDYQSLEGIATMAAKHVQQLGDIEPADEDDRAFISLLRESFIEESSRCGDLWMSSQRYGDMRDALALYCELLNDVLKDVDMKLQRLEAWEREIRELAVKDQYQLNSRVVMAIGQKRNFDAVIRDIDRELGQFARTRARAKLLERKAKSEKDELDDMLNELEREDLSAKAGLLPPATPPAQAVGLADSAQYARLNPAWREVIDKWIKEYDSLYGDLADVYNEQAELSAKIPPLIAVYEARQKQLVKWREQLVAAKKAAGE
ncbi:MAG: hypothetical protein AAGI68_16185 [Planctomycetota bacterium]